MSVVNHSNLIQIWLSHEKEISPHTQVALEKLSPEHISGISLAQLDSPMMKQYRSAKEEIPDALLFFRMGDFYELFGIDAVIVSDICGLTLTSRDKTSENPVPMAGTPVAGYKNALKKCIQAGFKVAVCDQVEDSKQAKGLVRREITRIATPAVPGDLEEEENPSQVHFGCYLASILNYKEFYTLAFVDVATGDFRITSCLNENDLIQELATLLPKEILTSNSNYLHITKLAKNISFPKMPTISAIENWILKSESFCKEIFCEFFSEMDLNAFGLSYIQKGLESVSSILHYLKTSQKNILQNIKKIVPFDAKNYLIIDDATRKHLDFFYTSTGEKKGSLFHFLNRCHTSTGSRLLLRRLNYPFKDIFDIERSIDHVDELISHPRFIIESIELLKNTADIDKILSRAAQKSLDPRNMAWLSQTLITLKALNENCGQYQKAILTKSLIQKNNVIESLLPLSVLLEKALVDDPSVQIGKGGILFRKGYHAELDEIIELETNFNIKLEELEKFERDRAQISNLKIGYNRVFGYYFEITKGKLGSVPKHFMRKQTLTNGERFITVELKELEEKLSTSLERRTTLEKELLENLRIKILEFSMQLSSASEMIAEFDLYITYAKLQMEYNWCKPKVTSKNTTILKGNVHPILSNFKFNNEPFIENDIEIGVMDENKIINPIIHLITGPNMAGKSTIMRQVAISQILCQIGSFIPAQSAEIGIADRILSRIGSADHALKNRSTFMVEMLETANILRLATEKSLLLLDEVGRGTSTFDGLSLAWALLENLHDEVKARTLFSTHYHEIGAVCENKKNIQPMQMMVLESTLDEESILFSRKYHKGLAGKSYGLYVAKLAGIPEHIIKRAQNILEQLEKTKETAQGSLLNSEFINKNSKLKKHMSAPERDLTLF